MTKKINIQAPLVWVDLEMSGLNPRKDVILEVALVVTDAQLNVIAAGPDLVIHQSEETFASMDQWCQKQHKKTGLIEACLSSCCSIEQAQKEILIFLQQYCKPNESPLCGNSIWNDKAFLSVYMPDVIKFLHYRIIDVSSIKELVARWYLQQYNDGFKKNDQHRAMEDVYQSIEELKWYRKNFFMP
jgi:oligoribonuclease